MKPFNILDHEIKNKLSHWLDPRERFKDKFDAIREKYRKKRLAEQKAKRKAEG